MATRTKKYQECDRLDCRKRIGVRKVKITIEAMPALDATKPVETGPGSLQELILGLKGELCPTHLRLAVRQTKSWFRNTKYYQEDEQCESTD